MTNPFRLLEVARLVEDEVNRLLDDSKLSILHRAQLRDSAQSVPANIREGLGKPAGPDRSKSYRDARGSAEETDEHLRSNFAARRIPAPAYWRMHHRLSVAVSIIDSIIGPP